MPSVAEVVALYLRHCAIESVHCPEARAERERTLAAFVAAFGQLDVIEAKPYHLTDFIESHPTWRSVSTRRARANAVRACFQWAFDQERIARNPFRAVRYAEAERRPDMPDDVLDQLASLGSKPFERALRFLRLTGCRLSELCRAQWEDVDLERGYWVIHTHKSRKRTGKPKLVALVPTAVALLLLVAATTAPLVGALGVQAQAAKLRSGTIFRNTRGKPWTRRTLGQTLARLKKRHGIAERASLHGVRHAAATAMIAGGAPLALVAEQLGHSSTAVTEKAYWHPGPEHIEQLRAAVQRGTPTK